MAGNEIGAVYQVSASDGAFPKAKMGDGQSPRFFGIVFKISLCCHIRVIADNFNGIFGGADSAVTAQSPELAGNNVVGSGVGYLWNC